ncbi:hypothetical protein [Candidatus Finniella inopinata]|uniref:Uncharacterized protein n=1 Tax=Candidatus Finniella inopinata TaxID=1696036 RepID=A0A4Q7DHK4_9PROT|nr:hypothetical protein [Candidatus Finniella inopinata]RZI46411.1 hypothetical protein EQU50_02125 [Candidatus Finniella inopinata]
MANNMQKKADCAEFKFKVAIAAIKGDKTTAELCSYTRVCRLRFMGKQFFNCFQGTRFQESGSRRIQHTNHIIERIMKFCLYRL